MLIFLIGYMGCGKSTIGRKLLKRRRGAVLVDTDQLIEEREGVTISEIFERHGEQHFRALEQEVLSELIEQEGEVIVSTGGGLPLWGDNMERMNSAGATIYIRRTAENIASRLSANGRAKRPKLRGLSDDEMIAFMRRNINERDGVYRTSQLVIEAVPLRDNEILDMIETHVDSNE